MRPLLLAALLSLVVGACVRAPPKVAGLREAVSAVPGGYVEGRILRLEKVAVLEDRDFIYGIGLSPSGDRAVHTRLAGKTSNAMLWRLTGVAPALVVDLALNDYEFDVEGVDFAPDGEAFVTAGRDGAVRAFTAAEGKPLAQWVGDERLVSVAFLADGQHLVAGGQDGLLTVLSWPDLNWVSQLRAHADEVRSVAATFDGRLVTGSWDRTVAVFALQPRPLSMAEVRLPVRQTPDKVPVIRAGVDGQSGLFAFDAALPAVVVNSELAQRAGIQSALLNETVKVGPHEARLARGRTVNLQHLRAGGVDVAVCDACVPAGAQGVLGSPLLSRFDIAQAPGAPELVFTRRPDEKDAAQEGAEALTLVELKRHRFEPHVNDVSVDRSGTRLGVAFSADKSERNREVYQREKRREPAPESPHDYPAIVDLESGQLLAKWPGLHRGVIATAGISPDGRSVASGGWDNQLLVVSQHTDPSVGPQGAPVAREKFGWIVRRARFSRDGRLLAVGAWTPQKATGDQRSDPSAVIYEVAYGEARVVGPAAPPPPGPQGH
jgi:WD40 repeat protein